MGLVIDTSALIAIERRGNEGSSVVKDSEHEDVIIPMIVWAELLIGVRLAKNKEIARKRNKWLRDLHSSVPIIEFNEDIANHYADIFAECQKNGNPIPQNDIAVAATAKNYGFDILVNNKGEEHFKNLQGVSVVRIDI